jgi:hypothetical protein
MSSVIRRWVIGFAAVQLAGLTCSWTWSHSALVGRYLWDVSFVSLFPGNVVSAVLIEKLMWGSHWSATAMALAEIPLLVAINAVLWFAAIGLVRRLLRRRPRPEPG